MLILALAKTPGSLLNRELLGDTPTADWSPDQLLLAAIADQLAAANWQRGGGKGSRPEPISPLAKKSGPERTGRIPEGVEEREVLAVLAANAGR